MLPFFLLVDILPTSPPAPETPWWLILTAILGSVGTTYALVKSTYELIIKGRQSAELKKTELSAAIIQETKVELQQRVEKAESEAKELTTRVKELEKNLSSLSTAMILILDEYRQSNPENEAGIKHILELIEKATH